MSATGLAARAYSARELQAAAAALADGHFSELAPAPPRTGEHADQPSPTPLHEQRPARQAASGASRPVVSAVREAESAPLVRVRAVNSGAGASTVALALADAADAAGVRARVLDAAAPAWSGLLGATATEMGAEGGWRRGRRGSSVLIDRVEDPIGSPLGVPVPRAVSGVDVDILDAGWSMRELVAATATDAWVATTPACVEVLVTRPHGLALSQTESALAALEDALRGDQVVVVVVGAARWSDCSPAIVGARLRAAHAQDAVLFSPMVPARALPGLGPRPLPKQLTAPSQRLLQRVTTITGPLTADRT